MCAPMSQTQVRNTPAQIGQTVKGRIRLANHINVAMATIDATVMAIIIYFYFLDEENKHPKNNHHHTGNKSYARDVVSFPFLHFIHHRFIRREPQDESESLSGAFGKNRFIRLMMPKIIKRDAPSFPIKCGTLKICSTLKMPRP